MLGFAVGRWGVGSLCGNYHKTIIQNLRSNTKANTKQSNDKTGNRKKKKTPPIRAELKPNKC